MKKPHKKINIDEDRISNLPGNVIERIMEYLPVDDAAATCVLSKKWRYVWANHPSLVLDWDFSNYISRNKSTEDDPDISDTKFANIVSSILLSHFGHIRKFVIDVSKVNVSSINVDLWLTYLCRRNLKVLDFTDSGEVDYDYWYRVNSCVFLASNLTHLSLSYCNIKETVGCFNTIQSLILDNVRIESALLTAPLLTSLSMIECFNYQTDFVFDISAPKLASLTLNDNGVFNLQPFFTCTDIEYVSLSHADGDSLKCVGKHLLDLLALWPKVSVLVVDGYCFQELATAGSIPDNDPISLLKLRRFALHRINLDHEKIAWILYILKNSPLLHTFEIRFGEQVMNETDEPSIIDFTMGQLRTVIMKGFTASRNEVIFINILLKCAPLLEKMLVEENKYLDPWKQIKILKEVNLLQRKHRNTEIIFAQNLVPCDI